MMSVVFSNFAAIMSTYNKPPLTYDQQIELLLNRGLIIDDVEKAKKTLADISYYRLSAYMLPFKKNVGGKIIDVFRYGTKWDDIYNLYKFDRKLRLLVFDAIERIEVAVRTQIVYQLSLKYGSHWQDDSSIFLPPQTKTLRNGTTQTVDIYSELQQHIKEQVENNKAETFIVHYKETYETPSNPPSWMCVEIMFFNHLSKICSHLKNRADQSSISNYFSLPPRIFNSWLHTVNYVRNICAHHSRLWNRDFNIVPERLDFSKTKVWISDPETAKRSKLYYFLCMVNYFLQTINPRSSFTSRLKELLKQYPVAKISAMGFPQNWEKEAIWISK